MTQLYKNPFSSIVRVVTADNTLVNDTANNALLTTAPSGVTLAAGTKYEIGGMLLFDMGTTSHTTSLEWVASGGLTFTSFDLIYNRSAPTSINSITASFHIRVADNGQYPVLSGSTNEFAHLSFRGIIVVNAGGVMTPKVQFSSAPGGTSLLKKGSYISLTPMPEVSGNSYGPWA